MGRFGDTWRPMKSSPGVLRRDREMTVFPLLSGMACRVVPAGFLVPLPVSGAFEESFLAGAIARL